MDIRDEQSDEEHLRKDLLGLLVSAKWRPKARWMYRAALAALGDFVMNSR
jgi:hypothetical protein